MESGKGQSDFFSPDSADLVENSEKGKTRGGGSEGFIGVLDVYIHEARDIHNICIYQNQDVYARLSLTSDPEQVVSSQIINGGGRNPVFDENVRLNVRTIDSSLRCEVWMLSRVRNYLEDQLLGFTLVPLRDVFVENCEPEQEFALSSSDLYHSPAGFIHLTLTYTGASPDVLEIPAPHCCSGVDVSDSDSGVGDALPCELDKIEFPDPKIVNENERMASEYFVIPCPGLECKSSEQHHGQVTIANNVALDGQAPNVISDGETPSATQETAEPPPLSVQINPSSVSHELSVPKSQIQDESSSKSKDECTNAVQSVVIEVPNSSIAQPVINVTVEPEQNVVQQEIVEIYMKSMQEFTEALAKMKLPMDISGGSGVDGVDSASGNSGPGEKADASKSSEPSPKVFYGSRAFF